MKSFLRRCIFVFLFIFHIHWWFRRQQKNTLTILLYHGVSPERDDGIFNYRQKFIAPNAFDQHLAHLKKHYSVLSLDEAVSLLYKNQPLPEYPLVITFDDGYQNNVTEAVPLLKKYDLPATIFVTTNFVDRKSPLWVDRLEYVINHGSSFREHLTIEKERLDASLRQELKRVPDEEREVRLAALEKENGIRLRTFSDEHSRVYAPLSWEEMAECERHNITFGAHTKSHPILSRLPIDLATDEIKGSKTMLNAHTRYPSKVFAYPNGEKADYTEGTITVIKNAGFIAALSTQPGQNTPQTNPYELRRFSMDGTNDMLTFTMRLTGVQAWLQNLLRRS